jgi:HEAT repeat protein
VAVSLLSVALVLSIFGLRALLHLQAAHRQRLVEAWRPLLLERLVGDAAASLPGLARRDVPAFLVLWNHLQESLRGEARLRLAGLARAIGVDRYARRWLRRRGLRRRLLAVATLGHLGDAEVWPELERLARLAHPLLSLTAARALLQIDARRALTLLVPLFLTRGDWPAARIVTLLREAGPEVVSGPLAAAADVAHNAEALARLAGFLDHAHAELAMPVLQRLLANPQTDERVLTACLRALRGPQLLAAVRVMIAHPRWHLRMEAAKALGRIGLPEDLVRLEGLLGDAQWWVRYRAAQAIVRLPFLTRAEVERLRDRQADRYARDVLAHVLAERALA